MPGEIKDVFPSLQAARLQYRQDCPLSGLPALGRLLGELAEGISGPRTPDRMAPAAAGFPSTGISKGSAIESRSAR
jgi:hypothetical protein